MRPALSGRIGLAACSAQRDPTLTRNYEGEFLAIYVLRTHQKKGLGFHLMRTMCEDLLARGMKNAALWVLQDNADGLPFYKSLGGKVIGEKRLDIGGMTKIELAMGWDLDALSKCFKD